MRSGAWLAACGLLVGAAARAAPAELEVVAEPTTLKLSDGGDARLRVAPASPERALRWVTSIGSVAEGRFSAGGRRAPGFAVVAAEDGAARGAAIIKLIGHGALATHTSPHAEVSVVIGGNEFGPVQADGRGDAPVPVEVPPGVRDAILVAVDRDGMSTQRSVELPEAPSVPGVVVAPLALGPGERGVITVFAIDERGRWRDGDAPVVVLEEDALRAHGAPRAVAPGRWDLVVEARALPAERAALIAVTVGERPLETARVTVRAAPPAVVVARAAPPARAETRFVLGARAGAASAFGPLLSLAVAAEAGFRRGALGGTLEVTLARGSSDSFRGASAPMTLSQVTVAALGRVHLRAGGTLAAELFAGAGAAFASTESGGDSTPFLVAGGALLVPVGGGSLVGDVRWVDVRYDDFQLQVEGPALGAMLTVGYRAEL